DAVAATTGKNTEKRGDTREKTEFGSDWRRGDGKAPRRKSAGQQHSGSPAGCDRRLKPRTRRASRRRIGSRTSLCELRRRPGAKGRGCRGADHAQQASRPEHRGGGEGGEAHLLRKAHGA